MPIPDNPYAPDRGQQLAMLLMSLGGGIAGAANSGNGTLSGISSGLGNFAGAMGMQQQRAMQLRQQQEAEALRERQVALHEKDLGFRQQERTDANKRKEGMSSAILQSLGVPGMGVPPTQPTIGGYGARTASLEGGSKNGGMVFNELGSGAYGPYQFMPGTWADVRTKNPELNLPADMTQAGADQHKAAFDAFTKGNASILQQSGIQPTPENLYLAHRFGAGGATTMLRADPNARLADVLPADWQRQNPDMRGQTVAGFQRLAGERMQGVGQPYQASGETTAYGPRSVLPSGVQTAQAGGMPRIPQGDMTGGPPADAPQDIDPQIKAAIAAIAPHDPEKAAAMLVQARSALVKTGAKTDQWYPLTQDDGKMFLGQGYDPMKAYQRNRVTGEIKAIGQPLVNIENKSQTEFAKEVGKNDAARLKAIQDAESTMSDFASKISFATEQFKQTYTGPAGEAANAFFKGLGAVGLDEFAKKANAADAGMAIISQMKPHMRAAGSGASSDKDMDMFARALPGLLNMPGGNELIATYFQRLADRATQIRQIAEEHSQGGTVPLTGTKFGDAIKKLGPLFSPDEIKQMQEVGKAKAEPLAPPSGYKLVTPGGMTPMPNLPPPPPGFKAVR